MPRTPGPYLRQVPDLQVEADDEGVPADPQHQPHRVLPAQSEAVRARRRAAPRASPASSRRPAPPGLTAPTMMRYLDLYWMVPKMPRMTAMMCKKLARMGAHW